MLLTGMVSYDAWNYFYNVFDNAIKENIPVNHATSKKNIYMTREAMRLKNTKYRLWRKYCMTRTQSDHDAFACVCNDLRLLTRSLRRNFEQSITANIHHNPKAFWRYAKSRLKTRATYCDIHDSDGNLLHADSAKASAFNQYFSNVFINEDCTDLPSFSIGHTVPSLNDVDTSPSVVFHKLIALQCCKSPGPDGLPPVALKETAAEISVPLSIIFSKSLQSGQLPDCWKIANVVPIYKSGSRHVTNNYRPISLTCVIGKVLESIVRDGILHHLSVNGLLSRQQHGFLPHRSCTSQLLTALNDWTCYTDLGYPTDVIYFDFRKAFDTVPHARLLLKIKEYGISGNLLAWLCGFLSNRRQRVSINGHFSELSDVTSGVPQGSVLGPLLFTIYVNDIPSCVDSSLLLFADDTKLFRCIKSEDDITQLQQDIDALLMWSKTWLLTFNIAKCKHLRIGPQSHPAAYTLDGIGIDSVEHIRDLGVIIDSDLKFHYHVNSAVSKANRILSLISKSFVNLSVDMLPVLYKSLVRSLLEYGNLIWGPFYIHDKRLIESIQRRATRLVTAVKHYPYPDRLRILNFPSLSYRRKRGDMIALYQILRGHIDLNISDHFNFPTYTSTRGHMMKLFKSRSSSRVRSNFFSYRVINDWNSLPDYIINSPSVSIFKHHLDCHWSALLYDNDFN